MLAAMPDVLSALVSLSRRAHALGLVQATSGNFSARLGEDRFAISASGLDKGALRESDFVVVDLALNVVDPTAGARPSAEAALHAALYRLRPDAGAIAHTHSIAATVVSRRTRGDEVALEGYELAKALSGITTHDEVVRLPILENSQDMHAVAAAATALGARVRHGLLLRGHGLYALGADASEAGRHMEALEHLLTCALHETASVG